METSRLPTVAFARPWSEIAAELGVDVTRGLAREEVERRREIFGQNVVVRDAGRSLWVIAVRQFRSIVVVLLAIVAAIAFVTRDPAEGVAIIACCSSTPWSASSSSGDRSARWRVSEFRFARPHAFCAMACSPSSMPRT